LPAKVTQHPPPSSRRDYLTAARRLLRNRRFDLIFCGHANLLPVAINLADRSGAKIWLALHGSESWELHLKPTHNPTLGLVTAVSRYTRRRFLQNNRVGIDRVKVLPNTVDPMFTPGPKSVELLQNHGLLELDVLLTVGRMASMEKHKGQDRIISLMPRLLEANPNLAYVLVGVGDDQSRLAALANKLQLRDRVKFTDHGEDTQLVQWYRSADLFVMPCSGEGFGAEFLQAAACGCPMIGGNVDGSVDALRDGQSGVAVDPFDPDQLFAAIIGQLQSPVTCGPATCEQEISDYFRFDSFQQHVDRLLQAGV
jgi:glycosyltransferase involved in cell wall biosynthesis